YGGHGDGSTVIYLADRRNQCAQIDNAQGRAQHSPCHRFGVRVVRCKRRKRAADHKRFSLTLKHFLRHDSGKGAAHERAALVRSKELPGRYREQKLQQVAIKVRIHLAVRRFGGKRKARKLPPQRFKCGEILLKAGRRPEKTGPSWITLEGARMLAKETRAKPCGRSHRARWGFLLAEQRQGLGQNGK